ncbi:MAG: hypothetical protein GXY67_13170 [Clostridiales bacterium]|nr:hypothetical protein [Clostridiales bacterium]
MTVLATQKGRYIPGERIGLTLLRDGKALMANSMEVSITELECSVTTHRFTLEGNDKIVLALPPLVEGCYGIQARLLRGEETMGYVGTAVNVGGDVLRYGFLSDFQAEDDSDVECMAKYHIDRVQFYDWSYRHDSLVAPKEEYTDMMGKRNNLSVIRQKIHACRERGMLTMAYGAVYAASRGFWEEHRSWGLYSVQNKPMVFIGTFYYMDIESPWREHLFGQYLNAMKKVGFDGIHMDTYGEPKYALTSTGELRELEKGLPALIRDADRTIKSEGYEPHLIFNNVSTWPVDATMMEPQDAVYMELWPPMDRYRHLREAVHRAEPSGKPIVLAAYPAAFRTDTPERALYGELFLSFAIALFGATQLFLGEKDAVVTQGYYADYTLLEPWQADKIKAYQDFFVRFQGLLFDRSLKDISLTHCGGDNREYTCDTPYSLEGEADRLWLTLREGNGRKLIGLINLWGNDDFWNTGKEKPKPLTDIVLRILTVMPVDAVWFATPDVEMGSPVSLPFSCTETEYGAELSIRVPWLDCCGLLWL